MKTLLFMLSCVLTVASTTFGQSFFNADQSNYNISGLTGSFNVTISLAVPSATNLSSFDLFLQSNRPGANQFTITNAVSVLDPAGATPATNPQYPSTFATDPSFPGATYVNDHDLGFGYANSDPNSPTLDESISGTTALETLTVSYNFASPPASDTTFTFSTTPSGTTGPAYKGSYYYSDDLSTFNAADQANFTVIFTAVPEPSTWLAGLASLGVIAFAMMRRCAGA
jgi:PEP-CTERM motif